MIAVTEYELLRRLQNGDRTAFESIYHYYFKAVYNNVYKLTKDWQVSEDIVQEVFLSLWKYRDKLNAGQSVGGWLFVLSYNKSVDQLRKQLTESRVAHALKLEPVAEAEDNNRFELQWQVLETAIAQLSPKKRRVFELCKLEGKSYEDAASLMQISKHTVKEYLSAATHFLKEQVQRQETNLMMQGTIVFLLWLQ